jgi:hypothetical protein
MNEEEIPEGESFEYENKCECGKKVILLTQHDNNPEYYANIYAKCDCGKYLLFQLPVN